MKELKHSNAENYSLRCYCMVPTLIGGDSRVLFRRVEISSKDGCARFIYCTAFIFDLT